jgi:hypothetical protein
VGRSWMSRPREVRPWSRAGLCQRLPQAVRRGDLESPSLVETSHVAKGAGHGSSHGPCHASRALALCSSHHGRSNPGGLESRCRDPGPCRGCHLSIRVLYHDLCRGSRHPCRHREAHSAHQEARGALEGCLWVGCRGSCRGLWEKEAHCPGTRPKPVAALHRYTAMRGHCTGQASDRETATYAHRRRTLIRSSGKP